MSRQKKERLRHPKPKAKMGRPPRVMPPKTDRTAGEIAQAMLSLPADHQFTYTAKTVYRCVGCQWVVEYPDTLYRDGRCRKCRGGARVALEGFG
jgi:DNA-directed RNA polymerase subunit RPC12/RpoP